MSTQEQALQARVERERRAHTQRDVLAANKRLKQRFVHLDQYPSRRRLDQRIETHTRDLNGATVLDYGCGRGSASLRYLQAGAVVHGIDISPTYVEHAANAARAAGFPPDRFSFRTMDAHHLAFEDRTFDLVVGYGILHHLDPDTALGEIHRVLTSGGRVLLHEPLADNPLLKLFRWLTPNARTQDEKPFSAADLNRLTSAQRWRTRMVYCGLLEAPAALVTSTLRPGRPDNALLRGADRAERWTHQHGVLRAWNQYVLFDMQKHGGEPEADPSRA